MLTNYLVKACSLAGLAVCLLTSCQTTYSATPAGGGFSSAYAAQEAARPVPVVEEPKTLVASSAAQPVLVTTPHTSEVPAEALVRAASTSATGLQMQAPDTVIQQKQPEAPRKFGVTQGAHIVGGALVLAGGITTISGFNSDEPGWEPFAIVVMGIILAVVGGAMLLFRGKTARRRQKQA